MHRIVALRRSVTQHITGLANVLIFTVALDVVVGITSVTVTEAQQLNRASR